MFLFDCRWRISISCHFPQASSSAFVPVQHLRYKDVCFACLIYLLSLQFFDNTSETQIERFLTTILSIQILTDNNQRSSNNCLRDIYSLCQIRTLSFETCPTISITGPKGLWRNVKTTFLSTVTLQIRFCSYPGCCTTPSNWERSICNTVRDNQLWVPHVF